MEKILIHDDLFLREDSPRHEESDDNDSDDLQFVDNLQMEPDDNPESEVLTLGNPIDMSLGSGTTNPTSSVTIEGEGKPLGIKDCGGNPEAQESDGTITAPHLKTVNRDQCDSTSTKGQLHGGPDRPLGAANASSVQKSEANEQCLGESFKFEPTNNSTSPSEDCTDHVQNADILTHDGNSHNQGSLDGTGVDLHPTAARPVTPAEPAMCKILKHLIDGFVIEESSQPFPVHRSSLLTELQMRTKKKVSRKRGATAGLIGTHSLSQPASRTASPATVQHSPHLNSAVNSTNPSILQRLPQHGKDGYGPQICTLCNADCLSLYFYRGGPYCSRHCIKRQKCTLFSDPLAGPPKRGRPPGAMTRNKPTFRNSGKIAKTMHDKDIEDSEMRDSDGSLDSDGALVYKRYDVFHWTIDDVREYIRSLPGCEMYACEFEEQEIDGRALLLINEDHLLNALDIKLAAAIKIYNHISSFR